MKKQKKKIDMMCASHRQERGHPACVNQNPAEDSSASFLPFAFQFSTSTQQQKSLNIVETATYLKELPIS